VLALSAVQLQNTRWLLAVTKPRNLHCFTTTDIINHGLISSNQRERLSQTVYRRQGQQSSEITLFHRYSLRGASISCMIRVQYRIAIDREMCINSGRWSCACCFTEAWMSEVVCRHIVCVWS